MPDRPTADEQLDALIDRGVRSLVERNAPPGHAHQIGARVTGGRRWLQPALVTAALVVAAVGAGLWMLRESSNSNVRETRVVKQAPLQAPLVAPPTLDSRAARENVAALRPLPSPALPSPEADAARTAREAEASRARLMAYLDALYHLPPEVLLRKPPPAGELLPDPSPIVVPEIVITPLSARMESEDDALSDDFSPRGEE